MRADHRARAPLGLAVLGLAGLLAGLLELRSYVLLHDEGLVLQAAARLGDGDWPYRDYWWNYGPGQPALLAALEPLTGGPSLLVWRLVRATTDAAVAVCAFALACRQVRLPWALAAWGATLLLLLAARLPHPNATVALLALLAVLVAARRPVAAGLLVGVALWFRPEIGVFAVAAAAFAAVPGARRRVVAVAAALGAVLWLPFVVAAGPRRVLDQTLGFDLHVQALQRLPLLRWPASGGPLDRMHALLPLLLLVVAAGAGAASLAAHRRGRAPRELLALLPLLAGGAAYLAGRADAFHFVSLAAALPLAVALLGGRPGASRTLAAACAAALAVLLLDGAARRLDVVRLDTRALAPLPGPAADGVRADPATVADLRAIRAQLDRLVPGTPIWIGNARHDRVTSGATLAYLLLDRRDGTRYDIMQPGVVTRAGVQREIAAALRARRLPVVQWLDPAGALHEDSPAGRDSGGATLLDAVLRREYRPVAQAGEWRLLLPRGRRG